MKWPMVTAGELMVKRGGSVNPSKFPEETFELLSIPAFDKNQPEVLKGEQIGSSKSCIVPGDILLSKIVPHIRRCWIVPKKGQYRQIGSGEWIIFRDSRFDPAFLKHFLTSDVFHRQFMNTVAGVGGSLLRARPAEVERIEIPLPPLNEQKRIAAILDKADGIRRKRQQAIELADEFLRSVFLDMFGDPVTNPRGFAKVPITELADVITGFAFKSNEYVAYSSEAVRLCRGANTLTGYFEWSDTKYWPKNKLEKLESYLIESGDIILAMDRPWISSGLKVCIFPENERETYLVQRVARLRPHSKSYTDYLYSCIKSQAFQRHCCPTETTVPHISPVELKNFEVLLPDPKLIDKYHSIVLKIDSSLDGMISGEHCGEDMFSALSQKAFSGEL
ncbi:restriction endonuclease subunit S [Oceanospirillum sediminis]|uniref:Restriction endonuclease subunit S n=1 Tax=Oceanospirillum sediminis TaxID=2760088 RepID=A0A839IX19_9GAMM|nr:restriction endonuclease subunit S [Oceanospirillum sediminis]MBB1488636.1 restriction endonuclease subunit S [Oceanospirillum sediminis]